jgi:hypothetical protein
MNIHDRTRPLSLPRISGARVNSQSTDQPNVKVESFQTLHIDEATELVAGHTPEPTFLSTAPHESTVTMRITSIQPRAFFDSFCGILDIKSGMHGVFAWFRRFPTIADRVRFVMYSCLGLHVIGAQIILFFGALNKVTGVYGLISAFTGGSIVQLSFYAYSAVTLWVVVWGIRAISAVSLLSDATSLSDEISFSIHSLRPTGIIKQVSTTRPPLRSGPRHPNPLRCPFRSASVVRNPT